MPPEKYDNPPACIYRLDTSLRMISPHGTFTSYQVNVDVDGNNIVGDAANESSISQDPNNPHRMAIAWRQFDTWQSNFRRGGYGFTTDTGLNWTFPGVLQPGVFCSDPVTTSDDVGVFFYLSLRSDGFSVFCDDVWRSINGGESWSLISGKQGAIGGDKQWFTIDKTCGPGRHFSTSRHRLVRHPQRYRQLAYATVLFIQHGCGCYLVAQCGGKRRLQSAGRVA
jgi:hypothetical protein